MDFARDYSFTESKGCNIVRSKYTIATYQDGLTVFQRHITNVNGISIRKFRFQDCTYDFLLKYLSFLRDSALVESTCNNRMDALRAYLNYVADGDISMQVIALGAFRVPFFQILKKEKRLIEEADFTALLSAPSKETKIRIRDQTIMILLYDTAIR